MWPLPLIFLPHFSPKVDFITSESLYSKKKIVIFCHINLVMNTAVDTAQIQSLHSLVIEL